jgi:ComF family protein
MSPLPLQHRQFSRRKLLKHRADTIWAYPWKAAKALIFPLHCAYCQRPCRESSARVILCTDCEKSLITEPSAVCPRCGFFFPASPLSRFRPGRSDLPITNCPGCTNRKLWFDDTFALGPYRGPLREMVLRSKRATEETLTLSLGALLGRRLHRLPELRSVDMVINTPMHWKRRLQRGISTTELLLTGILSQLNLSPASGLLRCTRATAKQGMLSSSQRQRNVSRAFHITAPRRVRDQHLLVVDDVMTSGATLNEIARILHRAGARRISNVVLARGYCRG